MSSNDLKKNVLALVLPELLQILQNNVTHLGNLRKMFTFEHLW